jgi:hypothetical protein
MAFLLGFVVLSVAGFSRLSTRTHLLPEVSPMHAQSRLRTQIQARFARL